MYGIITLTKRERLEAIIDHYCDGKPTALAKKLGVSPATISTWKARNTYDHELLFAKCERISAEWLITGKGEMLMPEILISTLEASDIISRLDRVESN